MTTTVKHAFTNPKADGGDATIARPSDWNADHVVTGASDPMPNLVLNSDFGRRTVFGLAMPEVFADLLGTTKIDGGAAGSVAANVFTQGAANNEYAWCAGSFVWRDGRASAAFKAVATAGIYELRWRISATDYISVKQNNGNFTLVKFIASATTVVATVAQALTLNNWYWIEIERQGTTVTVRIYNTTVTTPGTLKASSTLLQTLTGTVSDASVAVGASVSITSDQATAAWGGIATGNGGVYVETWLPESWAITHTGTLGGQAVGYDEAADSGPINKQWSPVVYIPAVSRTMTVQLSGPDGGVLASTAYAYSFYEKSTSLGGSGVMIQGNLLEQNSAQATQVTNSLTDSAETSYTRKTGTFTSNAATRRFAFQFLINQGGARTGTVRFSLPQFEQGSAATAWRNAPADDNEFRYVLPTSGPELTTTSGTVVEIDPRDLAANIFLPADATVTAMLTLNCYHTTAGMQTRFAFYADGADMAPAGTTLSGIVTEPVANYLSQMNIVATKRLAAGKHRIAALWMTGAATASISRVGNLSVPVLYVYVSRGK